MGHTTKKKPPGHTFKLAVKGPDIRLDMSGDCGEGFAFALYMLAMGKPAGGRTGEAGEFDEAMSAYIEAAGKYLAHQKAAKAKEEQG